MNTIVFPEAVVGKLMAGVYVRADEARARITELEQALERIINEADEYDGSPANELVAIARAALGRELDE